MRKEAEMIKKEKMDAAKKKNFYETKINEENDKLPIITECINMFGGMSGGGE